MYIQAWLQQSDTVVAHKTQLENTFIYKYMLNTVCSLSWVKFRTFKTITVFLKMPVHLNCAAVFDWYSALTLDSNI